MFDLPDAPYIREAESYGTDSMYRFVYSPYEDDEEHDFEEDYGYDY